MVIKGLGSGLGALIVAFAAGESRPSLMHIACALALGFVSFGLSIFFYIYAQRYLGAARTSTFYALAPFIGVLFGWMLFQETIKPVFLVALSIMIAGTFFASTNGKGI